MEGQVFTYWLDTGREDSHCGPAQSQKDIHVLTESSFQVEDTVMGSQSHMKALKDQEKTLTHAKTHSVHIKSI